MISLSDASKCLVVLGTEYDQREQEVRAALAEVFIAQDKLRQAIDNRDAIERTILQIIKGVE